MHGNHPSAQEGTVPPHSLPPPLGPPAVEKTTPLAMPPLKQGDWPQAPALAVDVSSVGGTPTRTGGEPSLGDNARLLQYIPPPQGVVVLAPNQRVQLFAGFGIFDVDETQIEGTGEHVHDGSAGRFALGLSQLLAQREGITIPPTQSSFDDVSWQPYRACTGRAELEVCKGMVAIANVKFLSHQPDLHISPVELMTASHRVLDDGWQSFIAKIRPIPGVHQLLLDFQRHNIKLGICSASSEKFVVRAMSDLALYHHFDHAVTGATKKVQDGQFDGSPVAEAVAALGGTPQRSVMFGDSLSDYAAAALAGVPIIILRLPKSERADALTSLFGQIRAWHNGQGKHLATGSTAPTLLIVDEFTQVDIGGRLSEDLEISRYHVLNPEELVL